MASSFTTFRYPITRVYPYKWYPWVVYVGGLCLIVFFSVFNFAANGYILTVQYTSDYNGTKATQTWAQKFALIGKIVSSCQSQNLPMVTTYPSQILTFSPNICVKRRRVSRLARSFSPFWWQILCFSMRHGCY
jgi:hypothetical protein